MEATKSYFSRIALFLGTVVCAIALAFTLVGCGGSSEEDKIKEAVSPDKIYTHEDIAMIATVGHGMARNVGTSARLFKALSESGVNVNMIDQGSSELNIIVGVEKEDYTTCINAIYHEFFD